MRQPWLPEIKVDKVVPSRKRASPKPQKYVVVKKFEIHHRPFDLRFRSRLHHWLESVKRNKIVNFRKLLSNKELRILSLYLSPQGGGNTWLTQAEVAGLVKMKNTYKFRRILVKILVRIWNSDKDGKA